MGGTVQKPIPVHRVHPATLWGTAFAALLLQAFLPLVMPMARVVDLPLLVTIYFALLRRNKVFGIGLGTGLGVLQDALSHGYIGIHGMTKALVGYLAGSASVRFDLESLGPRSVLTGIFVLLHSLFLLALEHLLLETPHPFQPLDLASGILVNVALGLILFQMLDRLRQPA
jgi:rod shape-determining protein MreD